MNNFIRYPKIVRVTTNNSTLLTINTINLSILFAIIILFKCKVRLRIDTCPPRATNRIMKVKIEISLSWLRNAPFSAFTARYCVRSDERARASGAASAAERAAAVDPLSVRSPALA